MGYSWSKAEARRLFEAWWYPSELVYLHKREAFEWLFQTTGKRSFETLTEEECLEVIKSLQRKLKDAEAATRGEHD